MTKSEMKKVILLLFLSVSTSYIMMAQTPYGGRVTVDYQKVRNHEHTGWESAESTTTLLFDSLRSLQTPKIKLTRWGGRKDLPKPQQIIGKKGFFRVGKVDDRWYFIDPEGGCVTIAGTQGLSEFAGLDEEQQYGIEAAQALRDNGFNCVTFGAMTLKHYSDIMVKGVGENILDSDNKKLGYIDLAFMLRQFIWDNDIDRDNFNGLMAVFHPDYLAHIDEYARENCEKYINDKHFLGYFIDNELGFLGWRKMFANQSVLLRSFLGITDSKNTMELPEKYNWAKQAALQFLEERGRTVDNFTEEDDDAFRGFVADYYYRTTTEALRRHDPNHLILGNRLHGFSMYDSVTVAACARWCDVVSINYYNKWTPDESYMNDLERWSSGRPFMVTEFYTKGEDAMYQGVPYENKNGGGWLVRTQADRGKFYQNFTLHLLKAPNCIGWLHFKYRDAVYKSNSGQEAFSNKGLVNVDNEPHTEFLRYVKQINTNIYSLIDYFDRENIFKE